MTLSALNPFSREFFVRKDYAKAKAAFSCNSSTPAKSIKYKAALIAKVIFGVFAIAAPIAAIVFLAIPLYPAAIAAAGAFVACVALYKLTGLVVDYMFTHGFEVRRGIAGLNNNKNE